MSAVITVGVFTSGYVSASQLLDQLHSRSQTASGATNVTAVPMYLPIAVYVFLTLAILGAVAAFAWSTIRRSTQHFSRFAFLPSLTGLRDTSGRRRLALVKNEGKCEYRGCGGAFRFYAKPTKWVDVNENGRTKRRITERTPTAECQRNPKHWYEVDIADTSDLN